MEFFTLSKRNPRKRNPRKIKEIITDTAKKVNLKQTKWRKLIFIENSFLNLKIDVVVSLRYFL